MLSLRKTTQGARDRFSFSPSPAPSVLLQVLCWASNSVGEQVVPCVFHVHPLGAARLPQQCQVTARSQGSLGVACRGAAKGIDTTWVLEVREASLHLYLHPHLHLHLNLHLHVHLNLHLHVHPGVQYGEW